MRRLYRAARGDVRAVHDRCELCGAPIASGHDHLWEARAHAVRCACQACALIIPNGQHYQRVPRRFERLAGDLAWIDSLGAPVNVAALVVRAAGAVVVFPGPTGLVEAEIDAEAFAATVAAVPEVAALAPDVEAIVWTRLGADRTTHGAWRTGIDVVFELAAALRASWVGMSGGPGVLAAVARVLQPGAR